jgi:hypothetical protein
VAGPVQTPAAAPPPADPYDSQYYIDLGNATDTANNTIAGYQKSIADAGVGLQQTYADLARQLALNTTAAQNAENARGGFAQGALGTTIGNLDIQNQSDRTNAAMKESADEDTWNTAIAAAQQGLSTEQIALATASAARKAALVAGSGGLLGTAAPVAPKVSNAAAAAGIAKSKAAGPTPPKVAAKIPPIGKNLPKVKSGFGYRGGF